MCKGYLAYIAVPFHSVKLVLEASFKQISANSELLPCKMVHVDNCTFSVGDV